MVKLSRIRPKLARIRPNIARIRLKLARIRPEFLGRKKDRYGMVGRATSWLASLCDISRRTIWPDLGWAARVSSGPPEADSWLDTSTSGVSNTAHNMQAI